MLLLWFVYTCTCGKNIILPMLIHSSGSVSMPNVLPVQSQYNYVPGSVQQMPPTNWYAYGLPAPHPPSHLPPQLYGQLPSQQPYSLTTPLALVSSTLLDNH